MLLYAKFGQISNFGCIFGISPSFLHLEMCYSAKYSDDHGIRYLTKFCGFSALFRIAKYWGHIFVRYSGVTLIEMFGKIDAEFLHMCYHNSQVSYS